MSDVPAAADQLFDLLPQDFTDARNRLARAARADGRAEEATAIAALRRPTVGAWLTNQLVRQRGASLAELLELGRDLRAAQAAFAGDELRRRAPERRRLVDELVVAAREIAAAADQAMSDAAEREVRQSLQAALADEDAADALEAGSLSRPLTAGDALGAFGVPADAGGTAAGGTAAGGEKAAPGKKPARKAARKSAQSGTVDLAERRLRDAKAAAAETANEAAAREAEVERVEREYADAGRRIAQLEGLLREARELQTAADKEAKAAREAYEQAKRADERAQRAVERAQALYDG